jgi:murein DD-endopeptidase MepM/ murein hydrolase activator NlpD
MPIHVKKIGVKILLGLLEAVKYLGLGLFWLFKLITYPFRWLWRFILRPLAYLGYRLFVRIRATTGTMFEPVRKTILAVLGHRYVVHGMMVLVILFVAFQNIYAYNTDLEAQSRNSLAYDVLQGNSSTDEISFAANDAAEADLFGSASSTGESLTYDQTGVLRPFPVFPPAPGETRVVIAKAETYVVQAGDTLGGIARRYGLSVSTVLWANNLTLRSTLQVGAKLKILPTNGVTYVAKKGDSISSIAKKFQVDSSVILKANLLASANQLQVGEELVVPGGAPPAPVIKIPSSVGSVKNVFRPPSEAPPSREVEGTQMAWPTDQHLINQYFHNGHPGVDINGNLHNAIYAATDGIVTKAGWNAFGYGNMILLDSGDGIVTRYGHASVLYVQAGDQVKKGQTMGMIGSTGHSTGPHLHFEVYLNGTRRNPLQFYR